MRKALVWAAISLVVPAVAFADIITPGFTFAVASGGGVCAAGTHFHSNTGGAFGNPAGKAEVGNFSTECVRGLSEYNLAALSMAPSAFVTFDVFKVGGLFAGTNDFPFSGDITILAYAGNNIEDISDYQAASLGTVGTFSTVGLTGGSIFSFDITSIFNAAIAAGRPSLGIRLQRSAESSTNSGAVTFQDFRLTTNNQSTSVTPEPSSFVLMATGASVFALVRRRRKSRAGSPAD